MRLAHAHGEVSEATLDLWSAWTLDPLVLAMLAVAAGLYWRGVHSAWRRGARRAGPGPREVSAFAAGMAALVLSLVWPLDALGEVLFSAHMAQHLVLMNVAAPLLVLGAPLPAMLRALPRAGQRLVGAMVQASAWRSGWRRLSGVAAATVLQQVVLWWWHTPRGVAAALADERVHIAMHATLLVAALLFWTAVLRPRARRYWASIAALAVTLKLSGLVCITLLLLPAVRYTAYGRSAAAWGLSPAEDEQLGWGLMMIVGSLSYLAAAIALFALWFLVLERAQPAAADRA